MMIASARLVSLIACIPLLGGLAIRAQVAAGTHANLYGYIVFRAQGHSGKIQKAGFYTQKSHQSQWKLTYSSDGKVNIHCDNLTETSSDVKEFTQGATSKETTTTTYQYDPAFGDVATTGSLEIYWLSGGVRTLRMSNGLSVKALKTTTTVTEYRNGHPTDTTSVKDPRAGDYEFHLTIQDGKGGWNDVTWEPDGISGAVTTTDDYSYYVDNGDHWLTILATWVVTKGPLQN
jgi:hypothetical protein